MYKNAQAVCGNSVTGHGSPDPSWEAETGETVTVMPVRLCLKKTTKPNRGKTRKEGKALLF